jgi:hypothetical protein
VRLTTACALEAETVLAAPRVVTGRGERSRLVTAAAPAAGTPARVRLRALGIDARVVPVGIDLAQGTLGVPPALKKLGWWRDGALPGAASGSILVAGHLDSSSGALGAFFWLRRAKPGDRVEVETAGGRTYVYRVVSVGKYRKGALPANVWSRRGPARLVLVTCGGPFDRKLRHYRDNLVVTAVPA